MAVAQVLKAMNQLTDGAQPHWPVDRSSLKLRPRCRGNQRDLERDYAVDNE